MSKILLIYTGGTIGMVKDYETGVLRPFNFERISERIPELNQLDCEIETISLGEPIDSSDMEPKDWKSIVYTIRDNYNEYTGFIVLTGSDTMSYTSSVVSFMLENLDKPVIFTGSQLPIGDLRTDAKENLITSIQIASISPNNPIKEVCLYFEYKLYRANRTTKISSEQFEAFTSFNYPHLAESGVHLNINEDILLKKQDKKELIIHDNLCTDIVVLKLFPGMSSILVKSILSVEGVKGVILETFGSGNTSTKKWFLDAIKEVISKNIPVVNVSQCSKGGVSLGKYEASAKLKSLNIIDGKDITTESAIAKMMVLLGENTKYSEFKALFETSIRGEMKTK
ncbi:MAG: asparaginase [Flavobacteriaceae bacterium]|nr:asparaginase [Flavobacteriaceae bacterium]